MYCTVFVKQNQKDMVQLEGGRWRELGSIRGKRPRVYSSSEPEDSSPLDSSSTAGCVSYGRKVSVGIELTR